MNGLPLHPLVVHIPIALSALMPLLSIGLLISWWRGWLPQRAWWVAAVFQVILVGGSFIAMETGEGDEETVEEVVSHDAIHEHEEAAEVFAWTAAALLVPFLLAGLLRKRNVALGLAGVATVGTIVVTGLGIRVGHAGGELVYVHNAGAAWSNGAAPAAGGGEHGDDDDDD